MTTFFAVLLFGAFAAFKLFFVIVHMRESIVVERLGRTCLQCSEKPNWGIFVTKS